MAFDFKKEYQEFSMPKNKPENDNVPKADFDWAGQTASKKKKMELCKSIFQIVIKQKKCSNLPLSTTQTMQSMVYS